MNKSKALLFLFCLFLGISCTPEKSGKKVITVTIEPQRYFVEQLVDSLFEVSTMVPPGISPETYDPSPVQIAKLADSKAYFRIGCIGFELVWMDKIKSNNPNLKVFDNSEGILFISSNNDDDDYECLNENHNHKHNHDHSHSGLDPHVWSSPKQTLVLAKNICNALVALDEENATVYLENLEKLNSKIAETDHIITSLLSKLKSKSFIIYHPALTYFARDYGLTQYSIEIDGKAPSPSQLQQLIKRAREKNIKTIFIQQEFDKKNAEIIAEETNCNLVVINPLSYNWCEEMIKIAEALSYE